jgi:putative hydrolase of the HAD superfamily
MEWNRHVMIKGITFDLWDTVFVDDSDEPKRAAAGRPSKPVERRTLVHQYLNKIQAIDRQLVDVAYNAADAAFRKVWHDQHVTWKVRERLEVVLKALRRDLPEADFQELIRLHEDMELEFRPNFVTGVHEAIKTLAGQYKLAVISDAIFSPGRALRTLLADEGLLPYFNVFLFSDEFGRSKPEPSVFAAACQHMNLAPHEIVHIGDREHNDILGPKKVGMHCVLCTAAIDRDSKNTQADAIFSDYRQLPEILETLNRSQTGGT